MVERNEDMGVEQSVDPYEGEVLDNEDIIAILDDDGNISEVMSEAEYEDEPPTGFDEGFNANLALDMEPTDRGQLAQEIMELVEQDEESRAEWNRRLVDGLSIIGVMDVPEDRLPFPRATRVNHPVLAEIMTQFQARAIEELFPSGGPAKGVVLGDPDEELTQQANRVEQYINYHLTDQDQDYFADTDQMLFYLPYDGSVFRKVYYDYLQGFPVARYVKSADFIVPYDARSLRESPRFTHRMPDYSINDIKKLQSKGIFADYEISDEAIPADEEEGSDELVDISDKKQPTPTSESFTMTLHETTIDLDPADIGDDEFAGEDFKLPYTVLIDKDNNEVLSIRRNWKEGDENYQRRMWVAHYKYLPGLGFYGWGILHIIGSLGATASGIVRQMLDTGLRMNSGGGWVSKDFQTRGEFEIEPGVFKEVDASAEELAKGIVDYPEPNPAGYPALVNLLEIILDGAKGFASMTETMVGEASNTGPVGTTIALIEQSMKVMSGIHKRLHAALRQELKMLSELIHATMPEEYPYRVEGEGQYLLREDFDERIDIVPVSDPNIFSSMQRIAIAQAVYQMVTQDQTGIFDQNAGREAARRMLQAMRVQEIEKLLPEDEEELRKDPVSENQDVMVGASLRAFIDQNHAAHIIVHRSFMQQIAAGDPETANQIMPMMVAHIAQHEAFAYRVEMQQRLIETMQAELPPYDMVDGEYPELPPEVENQIAEYAAIIAQQMTEELMQAQQQQAQQAQQAEQQVAQQEMAGEQERKNAEFMAEQARKQQAFEAEQQRKGAKELQGAESETMKNLMSIIAGAKKDQQQGKKPEGGNSGK